MEPIVPISVDNELLNVGKEQLIMMESHPLPNLFDLSLTRMYFHSFWDICARFSLLVIQLIWLGVIFYYGIVLGQMITEALNISVLVIQQTVLRVITMVITIFFALLVLVLILPVFLARTIKGVAATALFYLVMGTLINIILISLGIYLETVSANSYIMLALILSCVAIITLWTTVVLWYLSSRVRKQAIIKSVIKSYQLSFK